MTLRMVLLAFLVSLAPVPSTANRTAPESTAPRELGILALDQSLRDLTNPFRLMAVAAGPGQVDYGTLAYHRKSLGLSTVIVCATRGEEAEMLDHQESGRPPIEVRTGEALRAAAAVGADLYFLDLEDFGHSKYAEEAFSVWGYEKAVEKMAMAIRLFRPDVIITEHESRRGTGQQQAIARILLDAFTAAGDPRRFSGEPADPWQCRRIFRGVAQSDSDTWVNLAEYDPIRGVSYDAIGRLALAEHRSSGIRNPPANPEGSFYRMVFSSADERLRFGDSLTRGLTIPDRVARSIEPPPVGDRKVTHALTDRDQLIEALTARLEEKRAEGGPAALRERYGPDSIRVVRHIQTLERALGLALGLSLEVRILDDVLVRGQTLEAELILRNPARRVLPVVFHSPAALDPDSPTYVTSDVHHAGPVSTLRVPMQLPIPDAAAFSIPNAPRDLMPAYHPTATAPVAPLVKGAAGHTLLILAEVDLGEVSFSIEGRAAFDIAPDVEMTANPAFAMLGDFETPGRFSFELRVRNRTPGALDGAIWVVPLALIEEDYQPLHLSFAEEDEMLAVHLKLELPILKPPVSPDVLIEFRRERPAPPDPLGAVTIHVSAGPHERPDSLRVGVVSGFENWLGPVLASVGIETEALSPEKISLLSHGSGGAENESNRGCADLSAFDTIVIDELALSASPEMSRGFRCLLRFVRQGGNLVLLAQDPGDWARETAVRSLSPYSLSLSERSITVETAPVKVLKPDHPLMSRPNKIVAEDFAGWRYERARFLAAEWADEFVPLIESADPGEDPESGGLLVAGFGAGTYIYVAYSLKRQLRTGHHGAYRLMLNLLAR